jgi:SAM-dependent methyltransferase
MTTMRLKARNLLRAIVQKYGPRFAKKHLWNREFSSGRWNCLDNTGDARVQIQIEKYADHGHILDLGCGSGTTSVDLNPATYSSYTGVDISDVAVQKAKTRAREAGREHSNEYFQSDILTYVPVRQHKVILFGDSIYYVPQGQISELLRRYSAYLTKDGVFLVRIHDESGKHRRILETIENSYRVVEKDVRVIDGAELSVVVFRPA